MGQLCGKPEPEKDYFPVALEQRPKGAVQSPYSQVASQLHATQVRSTAEPSVKIQTKRKAPRGESFLSIWTTISLISRARAWGENLALVLNHILQISLQFSFSFLIPNHNYCVAETRPYPGPHLGSTPDWVPENRQSYEALAKCDESQNSLLAHLSPFLGP